MFGGGYFIGLLAKVSKTKLGKWMIPCPVALFFYPLRMKVFLEDSGSFFVTFWSLKGKWMILFPIAIFFVYFGFENTTQFWT